MRTWVRPMAVEEEFQANSFVSACIEGTIACNYPGKSPYVTGDGTDTFKVSEQFHNHDEWSIVGQWHGLCGNETPISFNGNTGSGYETNNNVIQTNRPIKDIKGYEAKPGSYNVTWISIDGTDNNAEYKHRGKLVIKNVDNSRPNHS